LDGKTEKTEFPCTTPGFGVANANYSKLQDIQAGDWLFSDLGAGNEAFVVLTAPAYNSATDITFWLLRTAGYLYLNPTYGGGDETGGQGHVAGLFCCTHSNGWYLYAAPPMNTATATIDVSNPTNSWLIDNPFRFNGHASAGRGIAAGLYNFAQGGAACPANSYCGGVGLTPAQHVGAKFQKLATEVPSFAGLLSTAIDGMQQSYSSETQNAGTSPFPFYADFRHVNLLMELTTKDSTLLGFLSR
jgi:hypothetical protein